MKHILLIATGGTIASKKSRNGLKPQLTPEELLSYISIPENCGMSVEPLIIRFSF